MAPRDLKNLSPFAESALELDEHFIELADLSDEIGRITIDSDKGLDRARQLLQRFSECSQRIGDGVQALAKNLDEARARAEQAIHSVSNRAAAIQERHQASERMLGRFHALNDMVRSVTVAISQIRKPAQGELTDEERAVLVGHLPEIDLQLSRLIDEAKSIKSDAQASNMKGLQQNADSLAQSLQSMRLKLTQFVKSPSDPTVN